MYSYVFFTRKRPPHQIFKQKVVNNKQQITQSKQKLNEEQNQKYTKSQQIQKVNKK